MDTSTNSQNASNRLPEALNSIHEIASHLRDPGTKLISVVTPETRQHFATFLASLKNDQNLIFIEGLLRIRKNLVAKLRGTEKIMEGFGISDVQGIMDLDSEHWYADGDACEGNMDAVNGEKNEVRRTSLDDLHTRTDTNNFNSRQKKRVIPSGNMSSRVEKEGPIREARISQSGQQIWETCGYMFCPKLEHIH